MADYGCTVEWRRGDAAFVDGRYSRAHRWRFDGGAEVPGSSSPHSVRVPFSDPSAVDPEEALVAAVSSCHMLWFLSLAAARGWVVDSYRDAAEARMDRFAGGERGIVEVVLHPEIVLSGGTLPDDAAVAALHHEAHARCDIAHSLRGEVRVDGRWRAAQAR
ncbi:MAG: OsmC family protein [Ramlibacter sp.]|jgi:organic hydroperoxide reductase OsmC/OhrA